MLKKTGFMSYLMAVALLILLFVTVCGADPGWRLAWLGSLLYLGPAFHIFLDTIRRDYTVKSREIILYQPLSPVRTQAERSADKHKRLVETTPEIYWVLTKEDLITLHGATADDRKFLEEYHRGCGLYSAPATNEFLQFFDSLNLYPFLVGHENPKTLEIFKEAMKLASGYSGPLRYIRPATLAAGSVPRVSEDQQQGELYPSAEASNTDGVQPDPNSQTPDPLQQSRETNLSVPGETIVGASRKPVRGIQTAKERSASMVRTRKPPTNSDAKN